MNTPCCRVRICIPHYFELGNRDVGYGSTRSSDSSKRLLSLARSLASLHALNRSPIDYVLNVGSASIDTSAKSTYPKHALPCILVEVHVFIIGEKVLRAFTDCLPGGSLIHRVDLSEPCMLPLVARDYLVNCDKPANISIYMEDDLVISDPMFIDKLHWFFEKTDHQAILMPHRAEVCHGHRPCSLFVDGPLRREEILQYSTPEENAMCLRFWDDGDISFDIPLNPHSGMFAISSTQRTALQSKELPRTGFVSPLETAATLTVLANFAVFKPSWNYRRFFTIEHAFPSYLGYLTQKKPRIAGL